MLLSECVGLVTVDSQLLGKHNPQLPHPTPRTIAHPLRWAFRTAAWTGRIPGIFFFFVVVIFASLQHILKALSFLTSHNGFTQLSQAEALVPQVVGLLGFVPQHAAGH